MLRLNRGSKIGAFGTGFAHSFATLLYTTSRPQHQYRFPRDCFIRRFAESTILFRILIRRRCSQHSHSLAALTASCATHCPFITRHPPLRHNVAALSASSSQRGGSHYLFVTSESHSLPPSPRPAPILSFRAERGICICILFKHHEKRQW